MELELRNIVLGYKGNEPLCANISRTVGSGSSVALVGRNGVGKSTLLRSVAGIVMPREGDVVVNGLSINRLTYAERAREVSYVSTENITTAYMSVAQVVALGRAPYSGWAARLGSEDRRIVEHAMVSLNVIDLAQRTLDTLSDGQRQRVMVARALAQDTAVMVLDEPTAFLDWENREMVIKLLADLARQTNKIIIFSTHELDLAKKYASQVWQLSPSGIELQR